MEHAESQSSRVTKLTIIYYFVELECSVADETLVSIYAPGSWEEGRDTEYTVDEAVEQICTNNNQTPSIHICSLTNSNVSAEWFPALSCGEFTPAPSII